MIRRSWAQAASIEETLALLAASLREVKKRIRPLFGQERVARNAGLFLEGLLEMNNARPVGCAPRQLAILDLGGNKRSWGAGIGMLMLCAISSVTMSSSIWRMR